MTERQSPVSFGLCRPLYVTQRSPERATLGPKCALVAERLGKPFMPWQNYVADVALEVDDAGIPAYHTVIIVVMRQQGKTELLLPVMAHRAMGFDEFGPQRILYTTQTGSKAREKWEDIHIKRLEESPFKHMFTTRLRINQEAIIWVNGSFWVPGAGTAKTGGTGDSLDFGSIDEAWAADERRELSMRPAMLTRPARQLWLTSMVPGLARAGTEDSQYLRKRMAMGRHAVENDVRSGIFYIEFGLPMTEGEGDDEVAVDPSDPQNWLRCMPALCPAPDGRGKCTCDPAGKWRHTITIASVKGDFDSMDLIDFCAEYLSQWPKDNRPTWTLVKESVWTDLMDTQSQPRSAVCMGIDLDEDRARAFIAVAGKRYDRDWHVEVVEPGDEVAEDLLGLEWVIDRAVEICERNDVLAVVIDPRGPAQSLILPLTGKLKELGIDLLTPNTLEISAQCQRLYDAITGKRQEEDEGKPGARVRHIGQKTLSNAVAYARKLISAKNRTFAWDRIGGVVSISPLFAVTLAMHGYEAKMDDDYDVLDSVLGLDGECGDCGKYPPYPDGPIDHYDDCRIALPKPEPEEGEASA